MNISQSIFDCISDGDFCEKLGSIEYSTNPRKVVTVGDMMKHNRIRLQSFYDELETRVIYGLNVKGMIIDEFA